MASDFYVFSTLATDMRYTVYLQKGKGSPNIKDEKATVFIKGGAGVMQKRGLITSRGEVTGITAEQYGVLQKDPCFLHHVKEGHIKVEKRNADPEKVAADMKSRDRGSDQLVEEDFKDQKDLKVKVAKSGT